MAVHHVIAADDKNVRHRFRYRYFIAFMVVICSLMIRMYNQMIIHQYNIASKISSTTDRSQQLGELQTSMIHQSITEPTMSSIDNNNNNSNSNTTIWIVGKSWAEGLSGWMVSFSKVMILAKRLDAVIVEPGIKDARLTTAEKGNVMLSHIFNRTILEEYFQQQDPSLGNRPKDQHEQHQSQQQRIATLGQYRAALEEHKKKARDDGSDEEENIIVFDLCLHKKKFKYCEVSSPVRRGGVSGQKQNIPTEIGRKQSPTLNAIIEEATSDIVTTTTTNKNNKMIILQLHKVWIHSFDTFQIPTTSMKSNGWLSTSWSWPLSLLQNFWNNNDNGNKLLIPPSEVEYVNSKYFQFSDAMIQQADDSLFRLLSPFTTTNADEKSRRDDNNNNIIENDDNSSENITSSIQRPSSIATTTKRRALPSFGVIHWRAELAQLDYLSCAHGLLRAKNVMIQYAQQHQQPQRLGHMSTTALGTTKTNHTGDDSISTIPTKSIQRQQDIPFILMSSLSLDESIEWNGARKHATNTTAREALELLLSSSSSSSDGGQQNDHRHRGRPKFLKLENAFLASSSSSSSSTAANKFPPDKVYYPVFDLIVAQRAMLFGTCTKPCHRKHNGKGYPVGSKKIPQGTGYCTACNFVGKFAELALRLRQHDQHVHHRHGSMEAVDNSNSETHHDWSCWPGS